MVTVFYIVYLALIISYGESRTNFISLARNECGCPDRTESFLCISNDDRVELIVWSGTTLEFVCNENLTLSRLLNVTMDGCNTTNGLSHVDCLDPSCSISRLDVELRPELARSFVSCSAINSDTGEQLLGSKVLNFPILPANQTASEERISVSIIHSSQVLVFSWNKADYSGSSPCYNITYNNHCGECVLIPANTITSVMLATCTKFRTSSSGETRCNFTVQTIICDTPVINSTKEVNLTVPAAPGVTFTPRYRDSNTHPSSLANSLKGFLISAKVENINISDGVDGSIATCTITYSSNTSTAFTEVFQASYCDQEACYCSFDVTDSNSSFMSLPISVNITVQATNILGSGDVSSNHLTVQAKNDIVKVLHDSDTNTIVCDFSNELSQAQKTCTAQITNCTNRHLYEDIVGIYKESGNGNMLQINLGRFAGCYCYTVTVESEELEHPVIVEGEFESAGSMNTATFFIGIMMTAMVFATV